MSSRGTRGVLNSPHGFNVPDSKSTRGCRMGECKWYVPHCIPCARQFLSPCIGIGHFGRPRSVSFHTPRGSSGGLHLRDSSGLHFRDSPAIHSRDTSGPQFRDSSGPLFSMYSKIGEEEDNKMTERWQADADGILIFVSPRFHMHIPTRIDWSSVGRFILCRRGSAAFRDGSGLETESSTSASASGQLRILSQEYLSGSVPPKRLMSTPSLSCR